MTNDLKPCPFCGSKAEEECTGAWDYRGSAYQSGWIECTSCGAQGSSVEIVGGEPDYQVVRDAWNARATQPEAVSRSAVIDECIEACRSEYLDDPVKDTGDEDYDNAIKHCIDALHAIKQQRPKEN